MAELVDRERLAAVLGEHAFADLGLGFRRVKGVAARLTGDDEQHRRCRGDHAEFGNEAAVSHLIVHDVREAEAESGAQGVADRLRDRQQHQHQRKFHREDRHHLTREADAGIGRSGGGRAEDHRQRRDQQQIENDDHVRHAVEGVEGEDRDKELQHHLGRQAHQRSDEKHGPVRRYGNDGLLAQKLEEIIERLQNRRSDTLLHPGDQLAVDPAQQQTGEEAEQESREDQDIGQILEAVKNDTHIPASLTE